MSASSQKINSTKINLIGENMNFSKKHIKAIGFDNVFSSTTYVGGL